MKSPVILLPLLSALAIAPPASSLPSGHLQPVSDSATFSLGKHAALVAQPDGILRFADLTLLLDYREAGRGTQQNSAGAIAAAPGHPRRDGDRFWILEADFKPKTSPAPLALRETLERSGPGSFRLTVTLSAVHDGTAVNSLRWTVRLPAASFAGRTLTLDTRSIQLPDTPTGRFDLAAARTGTIGIPLENGTLELRAPLRALVADNRHYDQSHFSLILEPRDPPDSTATRTFTCELAWRPHTFEPLDFRVTANVDFADDVAGDRAGGWTDEGKDHDLRAFPTGSQIFAGIPFSIIDPATNHGRAALAFAGRHRDYFLKTAEVAPPATALRTLYLLHAYAWDHPQHELLGTLVATHPDGTTTKIPVLAHRDAGNWTSPHDAPNGLLAWRGSNPRFSDIGLYLSRFELPGKPVTHLTLEGSGRAVWMIAGITGSPDSLPPLPTAAAKHLVLSAGPDWQPLAFEHDVEPGSILDFSHLLDAPAGKHGPLVIRDGRFYFENQPGQRARFFGANLNFQTNYIDRSLADRLALRLARMGYNAVRIHHFDALLLKPGAASSHDIDPEKLDRLDYLVSRLKAAGIHVNIDLFSTRFFPAGEIDELDTRTRNGIKPAVAVSSSAQRAWGHFARKLLTHRNPHTGLTWAEDPALVGICPVNENVLSATWTSDASIAQLYQQRFAAWLAAQGLGKLSERDRSLAFARFLSERQLSSQAALARFLKNGIGTHAPLTDINHRDYKPLALVRDHLDYVDVHRYWDHPRFVGALWDLPYLHLDEPALAKDAELPRQLFPTRIAGLPYTVTEFNYTFPNRYRAEAGPLFGAYAAFQDWDGIWRFAYNGGLVNHLTEPSSIVSFNSSNDPVATLADRLIALLFLRGDVRPSENLIAFEINPSTAFASPEALGSYSDDFSRLGLVTGLGTVVTGNYRDTGRKLLAAVTEPGGHGTLDVPSFEETPRLPQQILAADVLPSDRFNPATRRYRSDTGELDLDVTAGRFSVVTPRTEAFMLTRSGEVGGTVLHVRTDGPAMVSVSAMDDHPLATSRRLLLLHLTDVQNTGTRFRTPERKILEEWGSTPLLVRRGSADVTLTLAAPANASIALHALSTGGKRLYTLPVTHVDTALTFALQTSQGSHPPVLAYELEITQ